MAIQALEVVRIFYLLSISQLGLGLLAKLRGQAENIGDARAIMIGIVSVIVLQVIFSQLNVMNNIFDTTTLNINQWLICIAIGLTIIPVTLLANFVHPPNRID